jgi:hypothetical protein
MVMSTVDASRDQRVDEYPIARAQPWLSRIAQRTRRYAFIRPSGSPTRRAVSTLGLVAGSALLASSGAVHVQLWATGYRSIPTIGPLFLLQGIAGALLGLVLVLWRRLLVVVAGAGFMLATLGGLLISVKFGLFGFIDTLAAPYAGLSVVLESVGAAVLTVVGIVLVHGQDHSGMGTSSSEANKAAP